MGAFDIDNQQMQNIINGNLHFCITDIADEVMDLFGAIQYLRQFDAIGLMQFLNQLAAAFY